MPRLIKFGSAVIACAGLCCALCTYCLPRAVKAATIDKPGLPASMPIPADYREWIFLAAGLDMTYAATAAGTGVPAHQVFDNVFVNPAAYRAYMASGRWPDGTTFILENRAAESAVSINKAGRTQGDEVRGLEIHAKLNGEWAFYMKRKDADAALIPKPASCYTCHEQHAAVDTTFVQFYPTLMPVAREKHVLSPAYLSEISTPSAVATQK